MKNYSSILRIGVAASVALFAAATVAHAQDKVIKIGGLFPMSGPGSYFGVQDKQGIELALEQLNKTGVNGYRFEVQFEDSACSPLPATQAAKRLLDQYKPHVVPLAWRKRLLTAISSFSETWAPMPQIRHSISLHFTMLRPISRRSCSSLKRRWFCSLARICPRGI